MPAKPPKADGIAAGEALDASRSKPARRKAAGAAAVHADSAVELAYEALKAMAVNFRFRPGDRLNEVELCKRIGLSRTPLREALHRLSSEGFMRVVPGKGFYFRELDPQEIFSLYELRKAIETAAVRLAAVRGTPEDVVELRRIHERINAAAGSAPKLLAADEAFHEHIMRMSNNLEFVRVLRNVNDRLRFVRGFDVANADHDLKAREHDELIACLGRRDVEGCVRTLETHIDMALDRVMETIKESMARIYLPSGQGEVA